MMDLPWAGVGVLAVVGVLAWAFLSGRRAGKQEERNDDLQDDVETAKRIDAVRRLDADAARERLRNRKPSGDL